MSLYAKGLELNALRASHVRTFLCSHASLKSVMRKKNNLNVVCSWLGSCSQPTSPKTDTFLLYVFQDLKPDFDITRHMGE